MRHTSLFLLLIALTLVAFGCTSDSDDDTTTTTTTEAPTTAETSAPPEVPHPLPDLNPPAAENAPLVEIAAALSVLRALDRCEWTQEGDAALWAVCAAAARDPAHYDPSAVEDDFKAAVALKTIRTDADHLCFIDEDEIVTAAVQEDVDVFLEQTAPVVPVSEPGELAGGLLAYQVEDPIQATADLLAVGIPASPRYVLMPSPRWAFGPGGPALPADPGVASSQGTLSEMDGAVITVIDTGSVTSLPPEDDTLSPALRGHGQFIAGILLRLLPNARIVERSALTSNGDASPVATEHRVVEEIDAAMTKTTNVTPSGELSEGGVINLSLGTYACTPDDLPLELAARLGEMAAEGLNIAVVAAAGNDSNEAGDPAFWPAGFSDPALIEAAFPPTVDPDNDNWPPSQLTLENIQLLSEAINALIDGTNVIGVGALVHNADEGGWLPAKFSNQVAVTVWAPGANIVSDYAHPDANGEEQWDGVAQWDGTSFAAPHVAAVIANCADPGSSNGYRRELTLLATTGNCSP